MRNKIKTLLVKPSSCEYCELISNRDTLPSLSTAKTVPLVRVPWLEPGIIMKVLDAGAYWVICPMINSAEEAARFVACCR